MAKLLVYYAHPGHQYSNVNKAMAAAAKKVENITFVDLYAAYPRFNIDIEFEQKLLLEHDVIVFQFPFFWYSTPALIKEWQDLVLEQGFAYGEGGDKLQGKHILLAITAAGSKEAYTREGHQQHTMRTFLSPLEQTANLCKMQFSPPYVLHTSLQAPELGLLQPHVKGYTKLLCALRDEQYDFDAAKAFETIDFEYLTLIGDA